MRYNLFHLPAFLLALCYTTAPLPADVAQGEKCVRQGKYAEALDILQEDIPAPKDLKELKKNAADPENTQAQEEYSRFLDASYWCGRALVALERYGQAAFHFAAVTENEGHPLYTYAAKGIMYCAWKGKGINFVEVVGPLTGSGNEEIAALATAAMAEYQLRHTHDGDTSALQKLRRMPDEVARQLEETGVKLEEVRAKLAEIENQMGDPGSHPGELKRKQRKWELKQQELQRKQAGLQGQQAWLKDFLPMLPLLQIEDLRTHGRFDEALSEAKKLDENRELPTEVRHRARLAMAEIYYSQKKPETGEETLVLFIAANPDSPVLEEAFRRLVQHNAVIYSQNGGYTAERFNDWSVDNTHPRRAALALLMRQRGALARTQVPEDIALSSIVASAVSQTSEPAAHTVVLEHVRVLLSQGNRQEAARYLGMLRDSEDPRARFYAAACLPPESPEAMQGFLDCMETVPADLQPLAAANALYSAYQCGNTEVQKKLMEGNYPPHVRCALLIMHAALVQDSDPQAALVDLNQVKDCSPTVTQSADATLIKAAIDVRTDPQGTLRALEYLDDTGQTRKWPDLQKLRFYQLEMNAVDALRGLSTSEASKTDIEIARNILRNTKSPAIVTEFSFNLASRLSIKGRHVEAMTLLENLAWKTSSQETRARALLLAAEEAASIGSMDYYAKSLELFKQCTAIPSPYQDRAFAHKAHILMWTNHIDQALKILQDLLARKDQLSQDDLLLTYTVLADTYSMRSSSRDLALQTLDEILEMNNKEKAKENGKVIPPEWEARILLQHAILCSRYGNHGGASEDYQQVLKTNPVSHRTLDRGQWYRLAFAGAGAVYELLQLKKPEEAADLADKVAGWMELCTPAKMAEDLYFPRKIQDFRRWAQEIRRAN